MPLRPQLTLHEKQAYEGAKLFYSCFLPLVMLILAASSIIMMQQITGIIIYNVLMIGSYWLAYRYYGLCNSLDVRLVRDRSVGSEVTMGQSQMMEQQQIEYMGDKQTQSSQQHEVYLQKYKNTQPSPSTQPQHHNQLLTKPPKFKCKQCKLLLPYRSRHCQKCQTCIQRYDHHCFWIGNCVGYNNHRQFYLFLLLQTVNNVAVLFMALGLHKLVEKIRYEGIGYWMNVWLYLVEFGSVGFILFTGYLLVYHSMLMVSGMTTWEHMARSRISYLKYLKAGVNPFSKGPITNIKQFWNHSPHLIQYQIPTFEQAKNMQSSCNVIENQYYSCC